MDRIVGPGNIYVAAAKKLLAGEVGIDFVAGPTEIVIIAEDADPRHIAADMLAQAEHDVEASSILLTTSKELAEQVVLEVARQLETLPTAPVACEAIRNNSAVILCPSMDAAVEASNRLAPEHLAIYDASLLPKIQHAGSVFIGPSSPEAAGDYASGPNHVLPTSGAARIRGGLSSADFVKVISVQELTQERCRNLRPPLPLSLEPKAWKRTPAPWRCALASKKIDLPPGVLQPREAVLSMAPYSPPTGGRAGKLRLDFNENTVGASPKVIEYLREHLNEAGLAVYPEYGEVKQELADFFGVEPDDFILTNGTDEAIQVLINTYIDDGDEVLLLRPSYAMYRFYAEVAGASIREIPYRAEKLAFPFEELLDAIRPSTRAILIANPNNPTGTGTSRAGIERILEKASGAAVLIDEAYYEFCGVTALPLLNDYPNLFVSRTFSKVYGMAAMRLGCLFSQSGNVEFLHKAQSPYSVNTLATLAARAAIQDKSYIEKYVTEVLAARELLYVGLEKLGIPYYESKANFVLFEAGNRAIPIRDELRRRGVLVRDRSYEIPGCVRVTVGTRDQIRRFLAELEEIW